MIDSVFLLSVVTIFSGIVGVVIRYTFRSKCSNVDCCFGLCKIKRDIEREIENEQNQIKHLELKTRSERIDIGTNSPRSGPSFSGV